ncbi:hypothetical protein NM208_g6200 [Fusarium decemcellulare]|uniref:Uncharacterized protein n=1 Tax=Fusarium decemcellulare TaxID=57161 RepID=A0ACC1SDW6_9HYPO|nr:hypothetical protein NM208_g6200 [Fusarium decemcellulare]
MELFVFRLLATLLWLQAFLATALSQKHVSRSTDLTRLPSLSKVRTFVLTDVLNEPDDSMSLVRYLVYSNEFDTRGLVATTSWSLRNKTHPEEIVKIVNAYAMVVEKLNNHVNPNSGYPAPKELLNKITSGPRVSNEYTSLRTLVLTSQSYGRLALDELLSDGARLLIQRLQESTQPLYVGVWGGANTLAQALQHLDKTRSKAEAAKLRSRLRVYSISDQDDCGPLIRVKWPDVLYIVNVHGFREYQLGTWLGINTGDNSAVDKTKVLDPWLTPNIRIGPLGEVYPKIIYGMEGDTPSFLWLIQNGLSVPERPDYGGWGGRYTRVTEQTDINEYGTSADTVVDVRGQNYSSHYATIWRWRDAYQDDFAARMHWTVTDSYKDAAHPPVVSINGSSGTQPLRFKLSRNDSIVLDASETYDTDNLEDRSGLEFEWYSYPECAKRWLSFITERYFDVRPLSPPSGSDGILDVNGTGFRNVALGARVQISTNLPEGNITPGAEWHVILQVTNNKGVYPIRRYKRVIIEVS